MLKHIQKLTALQLCNLFGINEIRHTKDTRKKQNFVLLALCWIFLLGMVVFYIAMLSIGLCILGMGEIIPTYLYAITSIIILFFSFFKAGSMIFQMKNFDMMIALPISQTALVVSRFFSMYATNLLLSILVMVPGTVVYSMHGQTSLTFYAVMIIGTLILPMLPMTISTALGALFTGIGSRMKHKNLATAALTLIFAIVILIGSMIFGNTAEQLTPEMLQNLAGIVNRQIGQIYPPAVWFGTAAVKGNLLTFGLLLGVSILLFTVMMLLISHHFLGICHALNTTSTKNNYKMGSMQTNSILKALCKREIKHYFASSAYVSNTIMSYIMMLLLPAALLFAGTDTFEQTLGYPGLVSRVFPVFLGLAATIMPITACSISMEGKNWWLMQTLPIKMKDIIDSKILMNLIIAGPFYAITIILSIAALQPPLIDILWLILIPGIYILFSAVTGLAINMKFPVMVWENEVQVVKQSASTLVTMLTDFIASLPPIIFLLAGKNISRDLIMGCTCIVIFIFTVFVYKGMLKKSILQFE